ncbi:MAG: helix-turn-helix transcriptional regulator [Lachnospiraceae bacterium]|nr:helix-turn-helix transcriptional regulator [Lachnospiraceae bacterium]
MGFATIGSMIQSMREEKNTITRKKLSYGLCSEQTLFKIETGQCEADILLIDILIQRLGKSPDKFEMVLNTDMYNMVRLRDLLEKSILKGKRELAERILHDYPTRTDIDQMYRHRMRASLLYHLDGDLVGASEHLQAAIAITLPGFTYDRIGDYLISAVEMENLLALEKIEIDRTSAETRPEIKSHLESCINYIEMHFAGDEEYPKLCSKCSWLLARIYYRERNYVRTCALCERGMECLRRNTQTYFMLPLLKLMIAAEERLGLAVAQSKWVQYDQILTFLWESYAPKWCPTDSIFHNCYQRMYHLDYELIRAERSARGMSQEVLADGVYKNAASLSRLENGKVSSSKKTFEGLMGKLGLEKSRYNGYVVTDSFEVMDLTRELDLVIMRSNYKGAEEILEKIKSKLDMDHVANTFAVKLFETIIAKRMKEITDEKALERYLELLRGIMDSDQGDFLHILMRNEVLLINNICILLGDSGYKEEGIHLSEYTLRTIKNSRVDVKHQYLSYAILLSNYVHYAREQKSAYEALKNELICGKAMEMPFCLNNILLIMKDEWTKEEGRKWAKAIYYMSDLFYFVKEKEIYGNFLKTKCYEEILD